MRMSESNPLLDAQLLFGGINDHNHTVTQNELCQHTSNGSSTSSRFHLLLLFETTCVKSDNNSPKVAHQRK